jgi:hypothetical protein
MTRFCLPQNSIIPGPPFLFGACSVLLALLVALFIPEHTNLSLRSSSWRKHCGSHSHPHCTQAPGEAKEPLLQDTNVWQPESGSWFSLHQVWVLTCRSGCASHLHRSALETVLRKTSAWTLGELEQGRTDSFPKMLQFLLKRNLLFISNNFLPLNCFIIHPLIKSYICNFLDISICLCYRFLKVLSFNCWLSETN